MRLLSALVGLALLAGGAPARAERSRGDRPTAGRDADVEGTSRDEEAEDVYDQGFRLWERRQSSQDRLGAWIILRGIPRDTPAGQRAAERLEQAETHYRQGLDHLAEGADERARGAFEQGMSLAPMDPHHYLEIGDVLRNRGLRRAALERYTLYLGFLSQVGESPDPSILQDINTYAGGAGTDPTDIAEPEERSLVPVLAVVPLIVALFAGALVLHFLRRGKTLAALVEENPDLHPRIAYAIGCLRHELLKHRLGAIGDAVAALRAGELSPTQLTYLRDRLYGGDSLGRLWTIYLETFDRLGGRKLNLKRRDREFRRAGAALRALERLRDRFDNPEPQLAERLAAQRQQIAVFDRHLRGISERLTRSRVDGKLLREAVFSVQGEARAATIHVDEIRFEEPPEDVHVEVFRSDLLIILRNLVRNAVLALDRKDAGRRAVGLEVGLRTEPTGDESVLIRVLDTSLEPLSTDDIYGRRLDHGLGLVAAAVTRYDGSLFVEPASGDWSKAVVVRFFRALGENG